MEFRILNSSLRTVCVLEDYVSMIWTDRYREAGEFEAVIPINSYSAPFVKQNAFLTCSESEHVMVIESIITNIDVEEGATLQFSGRSAESILDRRIIWGLKTYNTLLQSAIRGILNDCFINPEISARRVSIFSYKGSTDYRITNLSLRMQFTGDNVYDVITTLCETYDLGFKIILNSNDKLEFSLYKGLDRSYEQNENPFVIFSPEFDNLVNANYQESNADLKNYTLIGGEDEGKNRKYATHGSSAKGLNRREVFTDARDIQSEIDDNTTLSDAEYKELLIERGLETLSEYRNITAFEGEAETSTMYKYGVDFFLGDIVQVDDGYGHGSPAIVSELTISSDTSKGYSIFPTFSLLNDYDNSRYGVLGSLQDSDGNYVLDSSSDVIKTYAINTSEESEEEIITISTTVNDSDNDYVLDNTDEIIEGEVIYSEEE